MKSDVFRTHHLLTILDGFDNQSLPLDLFLMDYCRANKALGSKDRKFIVEAVYGLTRWRGLLDFLIEGTASWDQRWGAYQDLDVTQYRNREDIPAHVRCSFPKKLFDLLVADYGEEKALEIALTSNTPAPTTIRVNALKTTREQLKERLRNYCDLQECIHSPYGLVFAQRLNFRVLPEFRDGFFEVQDEGSQLVAELIKPKPGDVVLDFCAGSGGKSLAMAVPMNQRGQLYLHDIRKPALAEARKRLRRAGIQNAQVIGDDSPHLAKLKKNCDWVLVDAPCSGTGTLRRNPDMKWRFEPEWVQRLMGQQRLIFERALSYLRPSGQIVYATCSLLKDENEKQVEHFLQTYQLKLVEEPFKSLPSVGGMDGFFGAVFQR